LEPADLGIAEAARGAVVRNSSDDDITWIEGSGRKTRLRLLSEADGYDDSQAMITDELLGGLGDGYQFVVAVKYARDDAGVRVAGRRLYRIAKSWLDRNTRWQNVVANTSDTDVTQIMMGR
jgi:hypothetical protein